MSNDTIVVYISCPPDAAPALAQHLVSQRLAACVNVLSGVQSVYRWQGQVEQAAESLLMAKTTLERYPALRVATLELHPNELPEIVAVPIATGHAPYLKWIADSVRPT